MIPAIQILAALYFMYVVARRPDLIVPSALYAAVFDASAIINVGSVAVLPYYFLLSLVSVRALFDRYDRSQFFGIKPRGRQIVGSVLCFALIVVLGNLILPRIFAGLPVTNSRAPAFLTPLAPNMSHVAQAGYLVLNCIFIWWIAQRSWTSREIRKVISAYRGAGIIVIALGFYQLLCAYSGLPYPNDLLHTNNFAIMLDDAVAGMPRISSTFTETAGMSPFMLGYLAYALEDWISSRFRHLDKALLVFASLAILVLSTSSTAYLGLGALFVLALVRHVIFPSKELGNLRWKILFTVLVLLIAVVVAVLVSPTLMEVVQQSVLKKQDSDSFEQRHSADLHSYSLAWQSYGFGVGLGSTWTSSFLAALIGSTGVYGALAFAWILYSQFRGCVQRVLWFRDQRMAIGTAAVVLLAALFISCPNVSAPILWVLFSTLTAMTVYAESRSSHNRALTENYAIPHPQVVPSTMTSAASRRLRPFTYIPGGAS